MLLQILRGEATMTHSVVDFHAERARLRPWADMTTSTLESLRRLKAAHGDQVEVTRITDELNRREHADKVYGKA
jgi:hypothetical protein